MENIKIKKLIGYCLFLTGISISTAINAAYEKNLSYCPPANMITKEIGGYNWTTKIPGWSGFYLYPQLGKGNSYTVKKLYKIQWIQSHNTMNSPGFIQCDYLGDYSVDAKDHNDPGRQIHEIIRLEQKDSNGAYRPLPGIETSSPMNNWTCRHVTTFPKEACTCYSSDPSRCGFSTHS